MEADDLYLEYDSLTTLLLASLEAFTTGAYYLDEDGQLQQHPTLVNAIINQYNPRRQAYYQRLAGVKDNNELLHLAMTPDDPRWRAAEQAILRLADEQMTHALLDYLAHPEARVRTYAAYLLGQLGEQQAVDGLMALLHAAGDGAVAGCGWDVLYPLGLDHSLRCRYPIAGDLSPYFWETVCDALAPRANDLYR